MPKWELTSTTYEIVLTKNGSNGRVDIWLWSFGWLGWFDWFVDESLDLGLDVRTGLSWGLSETKIRVFVEYRYSQFEADFERSIPDGTLSFNPTLQMHYLLLGLGITF